MYSHKPLLFLLSLISQAFTKIPHYEEHIVVQNLPFSVDPILLESDYQLVLPPLVADKCTVSQQKCDSTNILQRLTSRRKEKHKDRLRQWHEKLSEISQVRYCFYQPISSILFLYIYFFQTILVLV